MSADPKALRDKGNFPESLIWRHATVNISLITCHGPETLVVLVISQQCGNSSNGFFWGRFKCSHKGAVVVVTLRLLYIIKQHNQSTIETSLSK